MGNLIDAMHWEIVAAKDPETYFADHVRDLLIQERPSLPARRQRLGHVEVHWHQVQPGRAFIRADGGTHADRLLARTIVAEQLRPFGLREATETFDDHEDWRRRTADWNDLMAKAKRLIQSGAVRVLRNGYQNIVGQVQGDHGTYQPEIFRQDPNSRAITGSSCECGWGEFQNQPRTRIWKKYQDRPCAHILALYWQALATPLDEDANPSAPIGGQPPPGPGGPQGAPAGAPMATPPVGPQAPQEGGEEPQGPSPTDVLPQFQPPQIPATNPASVPGLQGPTPTSPVAIPAGPGGALSSVRRADDEPVTLNNGDVVQLRYDDTGTLVGRSEEHGAGQAADIKAGQQGEVLGTDPATGMVNVLWMGHPWDQNSYFEPYGATGWHFPSYLVPRPDVRRPGVNVRRPRGVH